MKGFLKKAAVVAGVFTLGGATMAMTDKYGADAVTGSIHAGVKNTSGIATELAVIPGDGAQVATAGIKSFGDGVSGEDPGAGPTVTTRPDVTHSKPGGGAAEEDPKG